MSFLQHFGLAKSPFSLTPDPHLIFFTAKHREAYAALIFAVLQRKGMLVLTGEAGTGKTVLIRKLLLSIPQNCANFSIIVNPTLTTSELFEAVLLDFGIKDIPSSKALRLSVFKQLLMRTQAEGKTSVVVIDEAHLLTPSLMEEVRLLSNFETAEHKLLQIILAGQNELGDALNLESMRQIKQRVALRVNIEPISREDVGAYIRTRWTRSGGPEPLPFTPDAIDLISTASRGIPRVINAVCDGALTNAYGTGVNVMNAAGIREVLSDLQVLPTDGSATRVEQAIPKELPVTSSPEPLEYTLRVPFEAYSRNKSRVPKFLRSASWFGTS